MTPTTGSCGRRWLSAAAVDMHFQNSLQHQEDRWALRSQLQLEKRRTETADILYTVAGPAEV
jgi:hypothetical protein